MEDDDGLLITIYKKYPELQEPLKTGHWTHDIFGCFENMGICILVFFCPCVSFGRTASELGKQLSYTHHGAHAHFDCGFFYSKHITKN